MNDYERIREAARRREEVDDFTRSNLLKLVLGGYITRDVWDVVSEAMWDRSQDQRQQDREAIRKLDSELVSRI